MGTTQYWCALYILGQDSDDLEVRKGRIQSGNEDSNYLAGPLRVGLPRGGCSTDEPHAEQEAASAIWLRGTVSERDPTATQQNQTPGFVRTQRDGGIERYGDVGAREPRMV